MAPVSLPLSFQNSFWSQDVKYPGRGIEILYEKLQQGVVENTELLQFIRERADLEHGFGARLDGLSQSALNPKGFGRDDGASLKSAFLGLKTEGGNEAAAHKKIAINLENLILQPFTKWSSEHAGRIRKSKEEINNHIAVHAKTFNEVERLRKVYMNRARIADDAEEEEAHAPASAAGSKQHTPQHSREILFTQGHAADADLHEEKIEDGPVVSKSSEERVEKLEALMGSAPTKEVQNTSDRSETSDQEPVDLGDVFMAPKELSTMLRRAQLEIPSQTIKVPVMGTYEGAHTGENLAAWFHENFSHIQSIEDAATLGQALVDQSLLRAVGTYSSKFVSSATTYYQFKPKAFHLGESSTEIHFNDVAAPFAQASARAAVKMPYVGKYIGNALDRTYVAGPENSPPAEPFPVRARRDARTADKAYRASVWRLDKVRTTLEEAVSSSLRMLQVYELDRQKAVRSVFLSFCAALSNSTPTLKLVSDNMILHHETIRPDRDIDAIIQTYRTGPFRPHPTIYESAYHQDPEDCNFGIDIEYRSRYTGQRVPEVLEEMLTYLESLYPTLNDEDSCRKAWIYEVPLRMVHALREQLNDGKDLHPGVLEKYDAPVIASTIKTYLLELPCPPIPYEYYETFKRIYPAGDDEDVEDHELASARLEEANSIIHRLSRVYLLTLDAVIGHLARLVVATRSSSVPGVENSKRDSEETFLTKIGLSVARCIIRPKQENSVSIHDQHGSRLLVELIKNYDTIFPPLVNERLTRAPTYAPIARKVPALKDERKTRQTSGTLQVVDGRISQASSVASHAEDTRQTHSPVPKPLPASSADRQEPEAPVIPKVMPQAPSLPVPRRQASFYDNYDVDPAHSPESGGFVTPPQGAHQELAEPGVQLYDPPVAHAHDDYDHSDSYMSGQAIESSDGSAAQSTDELHAALGRSGSAGSAASSRRPFSGGPMLNRSIRPGQRLDNSYLTDAGNQPATTSHRPTSPGTENSLGTSDASALGRISPGYYSHRAVPQHATPLLPSQQNLAASVNQPQPPTLGPKPDNIGRRGRVNVAMFQKRGRPLSGQVQDRGTPYE